MVRTSTIRGPAIIGDGTRDRRLLHRAVHLDPEALPDRRDRDRAQHRPRGERDPGHRQPDRREPDRPRGEDLQVPAQAAWPTGSWSATRARSGSSEAGGAEQMIDGVKTKNLKVIPDERGRLMEILRRDDDLFQEFGQVYMTTTYPGVVKAWHKHEKQTDNIACVAGMVKLVLYDGRPGFADLRGGQPVLLGVHNPMLVQIPAGVYHGWMCVSQEEAVVVNIPTGPTTMPIPTSSGSTRTSPRSRTTGSGRTGEAAAGEGRRSPHGQDGKTRRQDAPRHRRAPVSSAAISSITFSREYPGVADRQPGQADLRREPGQPRGRGERPALRIRPGRHPEPGARPADLSSASRASSTSPPKPTSTGRSWTRASSS